MIVSVGESLIDFTPLPGGGSPAAFAAHPGGSPLNVAVAVARLGHEAAFAGRLSQDKFGAMLREHLSREGVRAELVETGPEPTMLAFAGIGARGEASYEFWATGTADAEIGPGTLAADRLASARVLHIGSLALARPPGADQIIAAAEREKGRVFLSLDPNVRPELVADWNAYDERLRRAMRLADLVKVSEDDLETLAAAGFPLELDHPSVVLTRGDRGLQLLEHGVPVREQPALPATVVDTVGAGDATMAALLVALAESDCIRPGASPEPDWTRVLAYAAAAGAAACERAGADPPRRDEVLRRLP